MSQYALLRYSECRGYSFFFFFFFKLLEAADLIIIIIIKVVFLAQTSHSQWNQLSKTSNEQPLGFWSLSVSSEKLFMKVQCAKWITNDLILK